MENPILRTRLIFKGISSTVHCALDVDKSAFQVRTTNGMKYEKLFALYQPDYKASQNEMEKDKKMEANEVGLASFERRLVCMQEKVCFHWP